MKSYEFESAGGGSAGRRLRTVHGVPDPTGNVYNRGSKYRQPKNCLKGIVVPYTAFATVSTSRQVTIATVCGATPQ
jgi:hypothetical protein